MSDQIIDFDRFCDNSYVHPLEFDLFAKKDLKVFIKRDDLIHPFVSGNKWRKLKYHIHDYHESGAHTLVTYGGAYSNHVLATACAGAVFGIPTKAYVRGEELNTNSNHILKLSYQFGMNLEFIDRTRYRETKDRCGKDRNGAYHIPEGGAGEAGTKGYEELLNELNDQYDQILLDVGTGTSYAGLLRGVIKRGWDTQVHGVVVLKNGGYLIDKIAAYTGNREKINLELERHFGGFGKWDDEQFEFNKSFSSHTGILVDPVYTGKLFRAFFDMARENHFARGERILCIHTGGMTGILSSSYLES
jgi:1-aminocyclopropane-1-carboxylate deaminase